MDRAFVRSPRAAAPAVLAAALSASAAILSACAFVPPEGETASVVLSLGGSESRAVDAGWPGGRLPLFSSVSVVVSGPGFDPVERTFADPRGDIEVQVPVGPLRTVAVRAVPDWAAVAAARPEDPRPVLALHYGAAATIPAVLRGSNRVALPLRAVTEIPLPNVGGSQNWHLAFADKVDSSAPTRTMPLAGLTRDSDFEFDRFGRLYVSRFGATGEFGIFRYTDLAQPGEVVSEVQATSLALAQDSGRLYAWYDGDGIFFRLLVLSETDVPLAPYSIGLALPDRYSLAPGGVAAAPDGTVFFPVLDNLDPQNPVRGIARASVGNLQAAAGKTATATVLAFASGLALGLDPVDGVSLEIYDLAWHEGYLYVAAGSRNPYWMSPAANSYCRGKIVQVEAATLALPRELGWRPDAQRLPLDGDPAGTAFFSPVRFLALAPRRLVVADEGFYWDGLVNGNHYVDVDRAIAVDTATWKIDGSRPQGEVAFFESYSSIYVC